MPHHSFSALLLSLLLLLLLSALGAAAAATTATATTTAPSETIADKILHHGHRCVHDTLVRPMLDREDAAYAAAGIQRPTMKLHHRHDDDDDPAKEQQQRSAAAQSAFSPMRIVFRTPDLFDTSKYCESSTGTSTDMAGGTIACTSDNMLTAEKRAILVDDILPAAAAKIASVLSVQPVVGNLVVPATDSCGVHFSIPPMDTTTGVADADLVIYVAAAPASSGTMAWAGMCTQDGGGRAVVGRANWNPEFLTWNASRPLLTERIVSTAVHEIFHAQRMSGSGVFRAENTADVTLRGHSVKVVTTPKVVEAARAFFGCPTLAGMEIESQGGGGTAGSHWERRNARDSIMSGTTGTFSKLDAITLAAFEDLGGYEVNFSNAQPMVWGNASGPMPTGGCGFLENLCGTAAGGLGTYFCDTPASTNNSLCTRDRTAIGACNVANFGGPIAPAYFQNFASDPTLGSSTGNSDLMDFCPVIAPFGNRICTDVGHTVTSDENILGYNFGPRSRCIASDGLIEQFFVPPGPEMRCTEVRCPGGSRVELRVGVSAVWLQCPLNGGGASLAAPSPYIGRVICPPASEICDDAELFVVDPLVTTTTTSTATPAPTTSTTTSTVPPTTTTSEINGTFASTTTTDPSALESTSTSIAAESSTTALTTSSTAPPPTSTSTSTVTAATTTPTTTTTSTSSSLNTTTTTTAAAATTTPTTTTASLTTTTTTTTTSPTTTAALSASTAVESLCPDNVGSCVALIAGSIIGLVLIVCFVYFLCKRSRPERVGLDEYLKVMSSSLRPQAHDAYTNRAVNLTALASPPQRPAPPTNVKFQQNLASLQPHQDDGHEMLPMTAAAIRSPPPPPQQMLQPQQQAWSQQQPYQTQAIPPEVQFVSPRTTSISEF